jgi:hypothetical protein
LRLFLTALRLRALPLSLQLRRSTLLHRALPSGLSPAAGRPASD